MAILNNQMVTIGYPILTHTQMKPVKTHSTRVYHISHVKKRVIICSNMVTTTDRNAHPSSNRYGYWTSQELAAISAKYPLELIEQVQNTV